MSEDIKAIARNRTDARLGLGRDVGYNRLAVVGVAEDAKDKGIRNQMDVGSALRGDAGNYRLVIMDYRLVAGDDRLATGDNGSSVDDDGSAVRINKKMDMNDGSDV